MMSVRRSATRGYADHGWLKSFHSFSFAEYHDPNYIGVGNLRVINEDRIQPGTGFGTHSHRDMEIVSYVLDGELAHTDSMGNGSAGGAHAGVIRVGDVQRMSAGTGVRHSEYNPAPRAVTHFLQIWLLPDRLNLPPSYEQKHFDAAVKRGRLIRVASPDGQDGSLAINANASIWAGLFDKEESATLELQPKRQAYVHVVRGSLNVNGQALSAGDAATLDGEDGVRLSHGLDAEVLVFDLER